VRWPKANEGERGQAANGGIFWSSSGDLLIEEPATAGDPERMTAFQFDSLRAMNANREGAIACVAHAGLITFMARGTCRHPGG